MITPDFKGSVLMWSLSPLWVPLLIAVLVSLFVASVVVVLWRLLQLPVTIGLNYLKL